MLRTVVIVFSYSEKSLTMEPIPYPAANVPIVPMPPSPIVVGTFLPLIPCVLLLIGVGGEAITCLVFIVTVFPLIELIFLCTVDS